MPARKISRNERFVGPAADLVELGHSPLALVGAVAAALAFDVADDPEAAQLQQDLAEARGNRAATDELVTRYTGIEPGHGLFDPFAEVFAKA